MFWSRRINKPNRLMTKDYFRKSTMLKFIFDILLVDWPVVRESNGENNTNGSWFDDWAESFIKIHTLLLRETSEDPTFFVALKSSVWF